MGESRRLATILFADVVGSTARAETLDPEDARDLMSSYFAAMSEEIAAEGGTIEKYIGDAVMAVFGVPTAHEDDPLRAVRAARRMLDRLQRWNVERDADLAIRIGINTGDVLAAASSQDLMVTGDAVNVAARLEQAAEAGTILVGDRTARAARGEFELRQVEPVDAKGKSDPIAAWAVVEERMHPEERGVPGLRAPMVGRDRQLALLKSTFDAVETNRAPHLVTITGEAGVGKSRLMREFMQGVAPKAAVVSGRCLPYGEGVALWPLAEVLRTEAGILQSDPSEDAVEKIEKLARTQLGENVERLIVAALALTLALQIPNDPLADLEPRRVNRLLLGAWRGLFSSMAAGRPLVFFVEDIHWADELMLEILEDLSDGVEGPLLVLATARPDLLRTRPDWGGGRRNHSFVPLDPLTPEQSAELVDRLLQVEDLPLALRERILVRSDGNPFFLEEILRHLIDEGRLHHADGRWSASVGIDDVDIPDTVQAVILARLDLLKPDERSVIQHAAVVGRAFWMSAVESLGETEDIDAIMRTLRRRELVIERLTSWMAGETEYIFKHILTRDVAYESIPRRARAPLHVAVAEWIERTGGDRLDELSELLLHHYATAFELSSDEDLRDRAQAFAWRSLDNAIRKSSLVQSQALAQRAIELARPGGERVRAYERAGDAFAGTFVGDFSWKVFTDGITALQQSGIEDDATLARLASKAAQFPTRWAGSMVTRPSGDEVGELIALGLRAAGEKDSQERARLLSAESGMRYANLKPVDEEGERAGREAVEIAERLGDPNLLSNCLDGVLGNLLPQCRYGEAHEISERRIALVSELSDAIEISDVWNMSAWEHYFRGHYATALMRAETAVEASGDEVGFLLHALTWLTQSLFMVGRWDDVFDSVDRMFRLQDDGPEFPPFSYPAFAAAGLAAELRRDDERSARYDDVLPKGPWDPDGYASHPLMIKRQIHEGDFAGAAAEIDLREDVRLSQMLEVYCDLLVEEPSAGDAEGVISYSERVAERGELDALRLHARRLRGRTAERAGDIEAAAEHFESAAEGFAELGAIWESAKSRLLRAQLLHTNGGDGRADAAAALEIFERLGSVREIEVAKSLSS